jgi:general secretion pathway protein I
MPGTRPHDLDREPTQPAPETRADSGFTLVEVVIALGILAFSLSIMFWMLSNGIGQVRQADASARAVLLAQSVLAQIGADVPLRAGQATGQFPGGFGWHLNIESFGNPSDRPQWPLDAYTLTAEISWQDVSERRSITVRTLRLGPPEAER